jgi:hypothetical protein
VAVLLLARYSWNNWGIFFDCVPALIVISLHAFLEHEKPSVSLSETLRLLFAMFVIGISLASIALFLFIEAPELGSVSAHVAFLHFSDAFSTPFKADNQTFIDQLSDLSHIEFARQEIPESGIMKALAKELTFASEHPCLGRSEPPPYVTASLRGRTPDLRELFLAEGSKQRVAANDERCAPAKSMLALSR